MPPADLKGGAKVALTRFPDTWHPHTLAGELRIYYGHELLMPTRLAAKLTDSIANRIMLGMTFRANGVELKTAAEVIAALDRGETVAGDGDCLWPECQRHVTDKRHAPFCHEHWLASQKLVFGIR